MEGLDLTLKSAMLVLVLLQLLGGFYVSGEERWCYDLPHCGPSSWGNLGFCSGCKQSPINIVTSKVMPNTCLGPINFVGYDNRMLPKSLKNTGHYLNVEMRPGATISGYGFPSVYYLHSYHFHWGTFRRRGSEHAIDGKRYAMELHIVHTKNNMSIEEATKDPEGIAVLAFFIQKSEKTQIMPGWKTLADRLKDIPEQNNSVKLDGEFSLGSLLSRADLSQYYRYRGSLTTPDCNQSVIWTIYPKPIQITNDALKAFTTSLFVTTTEEGRRMQNNFRPVQPLNNRKIFYFNENAVPEYRSCSFGHQDF